MPGKSLLLLLTGLAVVGAVAVLLAVAGHRAGPSAPAAAASPEAVRNRALEKEVRRLRGELAALATSKALERQEKGASAEGAAAASKPPPMSDEEAEAQARARREALYAVIEAKLATEPVDPAWAPGATDLLKKAVAGGAPFGSLQSAHCATSLCKIVVGHDEAEDVRRFVEGFSEQPLLQGQIIYRYDRSAPRPITTIWLSREGHRLPRPPRS